MRIIVAESQAKLIIEQSLPYDQIRNEWSKVNLDSDTTTRGYGEYIHPNEGTARMYGQMNAKMIVAKKVNHIKPSDKRPFNVSVGAHIIDEKIVPMEDGRTLYMCLMDKN